MATYYDNQYRLIRELSSEGSMSSIYLCEDTDYEGNELGGGQVVLKVFNSHNCDNNDLQKKVFQREVESLLLLDHKNIVKIKSRGFDREKNEYYIVLEYISGKTFKELMNDLWACDYLQKIELMKQVLNGLEYLHRKRIVHRDIKPSNLMLTESGEVKIIDFGISKLVDTFYGDYTLAGFATKAYCSPEQAAGNTISEQSDIYSSGLVFFEIFSQKRITTRETLDYDDLPVGIREILKKMLQQEVGLRYSSVTNVLNDLSHEYSRCNQSKYIPLRLTKNITKKLYDNTFIESEETALAHALFAKEFSGRCYIQSHRDQRQNGINHEQSFVIYGKQFISHIAYDKMYGGSGFAIIDVRFIDAVALTANKERSMEIPYQLKVRLIGYNPRNEAEVNAHEFANMVVEYESEANSKLRADKNQKDIIGKWEGILNLQRKKIDQVKATLHYSDFNYSEEENEIVIQVKDEAEVEFTSEDLLEMTSAKKATRSIEVGRLRYYSHGKMIIDPLSDVDLNNIASQGDVSISKRMEEVSLQRQSKAIKCIQFGENINPDIGKILFSPNMAKSKSNLRLSINDCKSPLIDQSKLMSLQKALSAESLFLLQGPPGTGKTTFITELVWQILNGNSSISGQPDAKILITSQSHVAVDHSLNKIKQLISEANVIRIGTQDKFAETSLEFTLDAFCRKWTDDVVRKCQEALLLYRDELHLDDSIQEKNRLITEIDSLVADVKELEKSLSIINEDIKRIDILLSSWEMIRDRIDSMKTTIQSATIDITENTLIQIISSLTDNLDSLYDQLTIVIRNSVDALRKKQVLELKRADLVAALDKKHEDIVCGKELLGVNSDDDYEAIKVEIAQAVSVNEVKYKQYTKIAQLCGEWQKRVRIGDGLLQESINDATIVGATCLGIASLASKVNFAFDWVIVDEAGKATPSEILVPICLGKKVILVGDHKQLPPMVDEDLLNYQDNPQNQLTKKDLETSLFEYLEAGLPAECKSILSEQYRMHPAIGDLISEQFYGGRLISHTNKEEKSIPLPFFDGKALIWLTTSNNPDRKEERIGHSNSATYRNSCEVNIIFQYLTQIDEELGKKSLQKEVAIIAGYRGQRDELNRQLESKYHHRFNNLSIEINTVDAFQGRETDIVFYSVVRSNEDGHLGFLRDARRLNVAFSRARELLIVVGDHSCAQRQDMIAGYPNPFVGIISYMHLHKSDCLIMEV